MPDPAIAKVEDALADALRNYPGLTGKTIFTAVNADDAQEAGSIIVYTMAYKIDQFDELGQTLHSATIEVECIEGPSSAGAVSRACQTTIAHVLAALAADRTLGGMVNDIQEVDVAPTTQSGRDHSAASLQTAVTFFTARDDWFTIIGAGGAEF